MQRTTPKKIAVSISLATAAIFTMAVLALPASAKTLRAISGFPKTSLFTKGALMTFEKNLARVSGGTMKLHISGPDVIPTNEQFQPLQAGVFDLLYTHAAYHLGSIAAGAAIEAIDPDPVKRRETGIIEYVDKQYNNIGVKLVAVLPMAKYNIVLKDPVADRSPSLAGLKIRTASLLAPVVKTLGGAPVNMPPGEIYTALQKGVIDGFTLVAVGLKDYKVHEVTGYLARPLFAFISSCIFMNLDTYNSLSEQEKQWMDQAAVKSEKESLAFFQHQHTAEVAELKALGMKETQLNAEDAQKMDKIFSDTIWAVSEKKSGQIIKDLHTLALDKGMTR